MKRLRHFAGRRRNGFTLIEVLLASFAAVIILASIYGIFARAIKLRDTATNRMLAARLRGRAAETLRNDLLNAHFVGTEMAGGLTGGPTSPNSSRFPGYLRFTTATGRDTADSLYGDTQEVEYYIREDEQSTQREAGVLVRTVDRVLLADTRAITTEERLMTGVQSMDVEFFDGTEWQTSWDANETSTEVPQAVRVTIHPASDSAQAGAVDPSLQVLAPWVAAGPAGATSEETPAP